MKNKFAKTIMKHKVVALGIVIGIMVLVIGVLIFKYTNDTKNLKLENQRQAEELNAQLAANSRTGYVAITEICQGDILQDGVNVAMTTFSSSADQSTFATADCIGKQAVVSISNGTPITNNIVATEMPEQLNERECTFINLSANLQKGDFVDVRIMFPNGEDYIVVSKVSIQNPVIASNLVYLWLTENTNDLLSSAIVDANLHGAMLYTTKYLEPEIQPANIITYQPSVAVMRAMENNPNIVQESATALSVSARESIEDRLKAFEEAYPDFELKLKNNEDVDEALKTIAGQTGAAGSTQSGDTSATQSGSGATAGTGDTSTTQPGNGATDTTQQNASGTTDTTVTYGN